MPIHNQPLHPVLGPVIQVEVSLPAVAIQVLTVQGLSIPAPVIGQGLIDTGASMSAVDEDVLTQLGSSPIGSASISTPSDPNSQVAVHGIRLNLPAVGQPSTGEIIAVAACELLKAQGIVALLGRDFLRGMIFIYDSASGSFSLSF